MLLTNILIEYGLVIAAAVLFLILLPRWNGDIGTDNLGILLIFSFVLQGVTFIATIFCYAVNPIRIIIQCGASMGALSPQILRFLCDLVVVLPIPFVLPFCWRLYELYYGNHGKPYVPPEHYEKKPAGYRPMEEFREELETRDLFLVGQGIRGLNNESLDDDAQPQPAYVYNAFLSLNEEGRLAYAAEGMNDYVGCKILYVDGDMYAVIGTSESESVSGYFEPTERPYSVIFSEKETITTLVDGKYYPKGAIRVKKGPLEMLQEAGELSISSYHPAIYPVRKVERLDRDALNLYAEELQNKFWGAEQE